MALLNTRREVGEFKQHYRWMVLGVVLTFMLLAARVVQLQLIEYRHYARIATENITKTITLPATRGLIFDVKGRLVADNRPSYKVFVVPQMLDPERDIRRLAELLDLSNEEREVIQKKIAAVPARRRLQQVELMSDISREALAALKTHADELPGLDVVSVPARQYPFGKLASHAVGYVNQVNADDIKLNPTGGYRAGDTIGRMGVEKAWETTLKGKRGYKKSLVDVRGQPQERTGSAIQNHGNASQRVDPLPGDNITLSLDMGLVEIMERAFRPFAAGAAVVVDTKTGAVRGLFSKPSYDANAMSGRLSHAAADELLNDPLHPLIDKTVYETYYPGSTFKPISGLAALQAGVVSATTRFHCGGFYELGKRRFRCLQSHGDTDFKRALTQSCNVYYYRLAELVGLDRIAQTAYALGLGSPTGIGINSESKGFIATRAWYTQQYGDQFRLGFTLNAAIGQGNTRVTLLQIAMAYAALANGGTLWSPSLVAEIKRPDGSIVSQTTPKVHRTITISPEHLSLIREGLFGVVNDSSGTAYEPRSNSETLRIAGKTGTAQVSQITKAITPEEIKRAWYLNSSHAWFAGYAPADDPELAIVVIIEHGGGGGKNAAPIAFQVIREFLSSSLPATDKDIRNKGSHP